MHSLIPLHLSDEQLLGIEREAKDFALTNGITFRLKQPQTDDELILAPFTLFPSPFPRERFDYLRRIQPYINEINHNVAYDFKFITESLEKVITVDDFTAKLYRIYEKLMKEGFAQRTSLGLFRSDYMMNQHVNGEIAIKQVEVNVIASSFGGLAPRIHSLHKYIMSKYNAVNDLHLHLPKNDSIQSLMNGLIKSWELYDKSSSVILFVVERRTINISDQRILQFALEQMRPDIKVIRRSFSELRNKTKLNENRQLIVDNTYEIAVIYFRTGYAPIDYQCEDDWDLRLIMERSLAIKCPSIQYHMSGVKKIQQILSDVNILEKFLSNRKAVDDVMETFAGMWGLEFDDRGNSAVEMALKDPEKYVLKPQREGGGNNYYGMEIVKKLSEIKNHSEREAYILMDFIRQPSFANYIISTDKSISNIQFQPTNVVSELGIFGVIMGNESDIIENYESGHLLRSKPSDVNEGGVASGFGAIDSPFLM